MRNTDIFRVFLKYVSLNILGQMAYSCYTMADTFFVSASLGANGMTALNLAFPVFCLINGTGLMIGMGGGTQYSILKSRGEDERADRFFTNAVCLAAAFAALFVMAGLFFSETIVRKLGADDTVFAMTNTYLRVMLLFAPAFLSNNLLQCFVRNDGNPSLSMAAMISGSLSNVILDYIFIFPLRMGIFGAIFATGLAPVISLAVLSIHFISGKNKFRFAKTLPHGANLRRIISCGAPSFLTEATSGVVMFLFNFIILRLEGNVGVAAFGVITVISLVVVAIYTGLSQGIQPIISRSCGARDDASIRAVLKYAVAAVLLLSGLIYSIIYFGAQQLAHIFNGEGNEALQAFAVTGMKLYFTACPFMGFNIVLSTYFASTERPAPAQIISLSRGFFVLVPMAFLLSAVLKMTGVWCAYPVAECVVTAMGIVFYWLGAKNHSRPDAAGR